MRKRIKVEEEQQEKLSYKRKSLTQLLSKLKSSNVVGFRRRFRQSTSHLSDHGLWLAGKFSHNICKTPVRA